MGMGALLGSPGLFLGGGDLGRWGCPLPIEGREARCHLVPAATLRQDTWVPGQGLPAQSARWVWGLRGAAPAGTPASAGPPKAAVVGSRLGSYVQPLLWAPSLGLRAGARRLPHGVCDARQQVWSARARAPDLWVACEVRAPPRRCRDAAVLARLPVSGTAVGGGAGRAPRPRHRQLLPARRGAVWPSSGTAGPATTSQRALLRLQGTPPLCVQRPAEDARGRSDSTACLASPRRLGEAVA